MDYTYNDYNEPLRRRSRHAAHAVLGDLLLTTYYLLLTTTSRCVAAPATPRTPCSVTYYLLLTTYYLLLTTYYLLLTTYYNEPLRRRSRHAAHAVLGDRGQG
jgi:hypothetical protein